MELEKVVQDQLDGLVKEGAVEKIIRSTLEKTITSIIGDVLRDYSDFGKELKKQVAAAMNISFEQMKLVDYNHIVVGVVREQLDKTLLENAIKPISDTLKEYIGGLEKKEWKLSEIISDFSKEAHDDYGQFSITLTVDESGAGKTVFHHIYFDTESRKRKHECGYQLDLMDGKIFGFKAGRYSSISQDLNLTKTSLSRGFDSFIFRLYAAGATIEVDEDDCILESGDD